MDWRDEAKRKLREYTAIKAAAENIPEEITRLELEACSIRSATADGTPVKGGGSGREDRLLTNIVKRQELAGMLERVKKSISIVERGLSVLTEDERYLLDRMYIHPETGGTYRLMEERCLSDPSGLHKQVHRALRHFTTAMVGGMES